MFIVDETIYFSCVVPNIKRTKGFPIYVVSAMCKYNVIYALFRLFNQNVKPIKNCRL